MTRVAPATPPCSTTVRASRGGIGDNIAHTAQQKGLGIAEHRHAPATPPPPGLQAALHNARLHVGGQRPRRRPGTRAHEQAGGGGEQTIKYTHTITHTAQRKGGVFIQPATYLSPCCRATSHHFTATLPRRCASMPPCHRAVVSPCRRVAVPPCRRAALPPCQRAASPLATLPPCRRSSSLQLIRPSWASAKGESIVDTDDGKQTVICELVVLCSLGQTATS
jgi:hypothetical protein